MTTADLLRLYDQYCDAGNMSHGTRSLRREAVAVLEAM